MAPLVPLFDVERLPEHVNIVTKNFHQEKRRKGGAVDLEKCKLMEMVQYSCNPPPNPPAPGVVICNQVVRLFRKCADGLTVETTSWEPMRQAERDGKQESEARNSSKA